MLDARLYEDEVNLANGLEMYLRENEPTNRRLTVDDAVMFFSIARVLVQIVARAHLRGADNLAEIVAAYGAGAPPLERVRELISTSVAKEVEEEVFSAVLTTPTGSTN